MIAFSFIRSTETETYNKTLRQFGILNHVLTANKKIRTTRKFSKLLGSHVMVKKTISYLTY
jgi:hypothetical protein